MNEERQTPDSLEEDVKDQEDFSQFRMPPRDTRTEERWPATPSKSPRKRPLKPTKTMDEMISAKVRTEVNA